MTYLTSSFSIILILLLSINMFSGVFAVKPEDNAPYANKTQLINLKTFPTLRIAFKAFEDGKKNKTSSMHIFGDLDKLFKPRELVATAVYKTKNKLRPGDIIQMRNYEYTFLLYLGRDSYGEIYLENLQSRFKISPQYFEKFFTGKTIEVKYNSSNVDSKESNILVEDPDIDTSPVEHGKPPQSDYDWNNAHNDPRIIALTQSVTEDKETPREKCVAIFEYVQKEYNWHDHDDTRCSIGQVLEGKSGNCCELSRLVISMVRSLDIPVETRYKHAFNSYYCTHRTIGHIHVQFKFDDGEWVDADASSDYTLFGEQSPIYKETYVQAYYYNLPF